MVAIEILALDAWDIEQSKGQREWDGWSVSQN
jgi:hypothetical protein